MSFERWIGLTLVFCLGCAGFSRGETWEETDGADGADGSPADGDDDDDDGDDDGDDDDDDDDDDDESGGADDDDDDDSGETGETTGASSGPSFAGDVHPLLLAGCERCHSADGEASDTDYILSGDVDDDYELNLDFIDLDAPASSRLLAKTAGKGHTGGAIYSDHSSEYETMLDWIERGATP